MSGIRVLHVAAAALVLSSTIWSVSVQAGDAPGHPVDGTWQLSTSEAELRSTLSRAVDGVVGELHFMIRELARHKLSGATKVCGSYTIGVEAEGVRYRCDARETVLVPTTGAPLRTLNPQGDPVSGSATVSADGVVITWTGESGTRTNAFARTEHGLRLQATVSSARLPTPLSWDVEYRK